MEAFDAGKVGAIEGVAQNAEATAFHTGVIDGVVLGGMHGIDAQATTFAAGEGAVFEMLPLAEAVEDDVAGVVEEFVEPMILVGGRKHVGFAAHFLKAEAGFIKAAGGGAAKDAANLRVALVDAEGFLGEEDFGAALVHDAFEDLQIAVEGFFVDNKIGGLHPL